METALEQDSKFDGYDIDDNDDELVHDDEEGVVEVEADGERDITTKENASCFCDRVVV